MDDIQPELIATFRRQAPARSRGRRLARVGVGAIMSALSVVTGAAGCGGAERAESSGGRAASSTALTHPASGGVVDSAIPIAEALRRFRVGVPEAHELSGGARTRDALVARFVSALETGDTAALRAMELTRSEFAYLVYPSSIYTRAPYEQQPQIVWMLSRSASERGYRRLVDRYAGRRLGFQDYACDEPPSSQDENRTWRNCAMRFRRQSGEAVRGKLFGAIVERDGVFKFVNYSNDL